MICRVDSTKNEQLQELISKYGQNEGLRMYLEGVAPKESSSEYKDAYKQWKDFVNLKGPSHRYSAREMYALKRRNELYNKKYLSKHDVSFKQQGQADVWFGTPVFDNQVSLFKYGPVDPMPAPPMLKNGQTKLFNISMGDPVDNIPDSAPDIDDVFGSAADPNKSRYIEYMQLKKIEQRDLFNTAAQLSQAAKKKGVSAVERTRLLEKRMAITARIKEIEGELAKLASSHSLTEAKQFFEADRKRLTKIVNTPINDISDDDLRWAIYTSNLWIRAGDFQDSSTGLFWSWSELQATVPGTEGYTREMNKIRKEYVNFADEAAKLRDILIHNILVARVNAAGKAVFNNDFEWEKTKIYKDINTIASFTLDISHIDHALTQLMSKLGRDANTGADLEYSEKIKEIQDLVRETGITNYEWIQQTFGNKDNRITGNMVVRYTQEYYETIRGWANHRKNAIKSINSTNFDDKTKASQIQSVNETYFNRLKGVSVLVDVRKLFPASGYSTTSFTEAEAKEHKDLLLKTLGQREYDIVMKEVEEQLLKYAEDRVAMYNHYHNTVYSAAQAGEARAAFHAWERDNSPYHEADAFYSEAGDVRKKIFSSPTHVYSTTIAKRFGDNGKDLGFYDQKYEQMRGDVNKSKMYDYIMDLMSELRSYIPMDKANILQVNSIPTIYKSLLEEYQEDGIAAAFAPIQDAMKKAVSSDRATPEAFTHRDVLTGKPDLRLQTQYIVNSKHEIENYIDRKTLIYKADTEENPTLEMIEKWRKDIQYDIAMRKSYDLPKVMELFSIMAIGYKHKSKVDMTMQAAAMLTFGSLEEPEVRSEVQDEKALAKAEKLTNTTKAVEHYLNHFYGYKDRKESGKESMKTTKLSTSEDLKRRAEIDEAYTKVNQAWKAGTMKESEYQAAIKKLDEQYEETLGQLSGGKVMDQLLKYYQLVNLGWNPWSAASNLGFGIISNITQAADGRLFTQDDMLRAYSIAMNNTLFSGKVTQTGRKVSHLAKKLDVMKEARYEVKGKSAADTAAHKTATWGRQVVGGFKMQSATEFMNQVPIMLSLMFNEEILDKDGNKFELWDAYDKEGNLLEQFRTEENIKDWEDPDNAQKLKNLKAKIDEVIQFTHGNYDHLNSPILASKYTFGKLAIMFRRWSLMGYYERFGAEKYYRATNITRKGRYKSYTPVTLTTALAMVGTFGLPGIGTAVGAGIGLAAGYLNKFVNGTVAMDEETTIRDEAAMTLKYLLLTSPLVSLVRKAVGIEKPDFQNLGYSEVDAANLRKNLMEIHIMNALSIFGMLLTYGIKGLADDDDKKQKQASLMFLLNQMTRMNTDIMFYTNPAEFQRLNKNFIPLIGIATDLIKLNEAISKSMRGDFTYRSGYNKDQNRIAVSMARLLPFGKSYMRTRSAIGQKLKPGQYDPDLVMDFFRSLSAEEE